jgi:diaminopimelate decarboxylase
MEISSEMEGMSMVKAIDSSSRPVAIETPFRLELAQTLLETYGSPLYVYQRDRLDETIQHITRSIPYPHTQFRFASVTNGNLSLLNIFRQNGWGLHANTPGDIYLGLHAGFEPIQIVYSGSNLDRFEIEQALNWGVTTYNLDSLDQLRLFCAVYQSLHLGFSPRLGLRLNLPELTGDSRIGVHPDDFTRAIAITDAAGLALSGLHFYRGTGTNATDAFVSAMDTVIAAAQGLPDWRYLDFGGGFGYPYRHRGGAAFDWHQFGTELDRRLQHCERSIELVIEPGRSAIARCGTLLATVVSVKWQGNVQIVGVDTTVANLSVPSVHGGYREIAAWRSDTVLHPTQVCGNTTYSRDYLSKSCALPALTTGDVIAILDVGAYGYAMSSHFLHRPRPAEVLLEQEAHRLIRQREAYSVLVDHQVFSSSR